MGESLLNKTNMFPVSISNGGTGATTVSGARTNLEVYKATVLYDNASGTQSTITLSDSAANYVYFEIYIKSHDGAYEMCKAYAPNNQYADLCSQLYDSSYIYIRAARITITGTSITWGTNKESKASTSSGTISLTGITPIYIVRVVGYSY